MKYSGFFTGALLVLAASMAGAQVAQADTIINLAGTLNGAQDHVSTPWVGSATAALNETTDLFSWNVGYTVSDIATYGTPIMAHFHVGPPGVDGPIVITLADNSMMTPVTAIPTSFIGSQIVTGSQASEIAAGDWYVNVHTTVYPAGIIRGQLSPTPEPASLALLGGGLGLVAFSRLRRRQRKA